MEVAPIELSPVPSMEIYQHVQCEDIQTDCLPEAQKPAVIMQDNNDPD